MKSIGTVGLAVVLAALLSARTVRAQVPQALERLVRSRVDRLSPAARDAVRPASVLGLEFPSPC